MDKLNDAMKRVIQNYNAGAVGSIRDDGSPSVSPKATFVIIDDSTIAFGDIRSPGTVSNLRLRPQTEINFIDVLTRRAVRISGTAAVIEANSVEGNKLEPVFAVLWKPYIHLMQHFVVIHIDQAELINSPAYDVGFTEEELKTTNLGKLNGL